MFFNKFKVGFSLIEVNIAILIAAGGMLSLFALFPIGLRQSVMSEADLHQAAFASSFFEAVLANVKKINNIEENPADSNAPIWNDINDFWATAVKGTGIPTALLTPENVKTKVAESTGELIAASLETEAQKMRYVYREEAQDDSSFSGTQLKLPPQMFIRIRTMRTAGGWPNRYAISLISSHEFAPAIYSHNTVYSMEFYFRKRP